MDDRPGSRGAKDLATGPTCPSERPPAEQFPGAPAGEPAPGREIGGPGGPEPTRYGDWERRGRCIDF